MSMKSAAHHEAGHAVIAIYLGLEINEPVRIVKSANGSEEWSGVIVLPQDNRMATLVALCAGECAEEIVGEDGSDSASHAQGDDEVFRSVAKSMGLDKSETETAQQMAHCLAQHLASEEGVREMIVKVAQELLSAKSETTETKSLAANHVQQIVAPLLDDGGVLLGSQEDIQDVIKKFRNR